MAEELVMPRLSDTMEEGTISKWLKHEGDTIARGDVVAEIETDKANMEFNSYLDGVITKIVVPEGGTATLGSVIAYVGDASEVGAGPAPSAMHASDGASPRGRTTHLSPEQERDAREAPLEASTQTQEKPATYGATAPEPAQPPAGEREASAASSTIAGTGLAPPASPSPARPTHAASRDESVDRVKASPLARKVASERGIDLAGVTGSGPGGRITREDVEAAIAAPPQPATPAASQPPVTAPAKHDEAAPGVADESRRSMSRMESVIARRMVESKTTIPHFYVTSEVAMDEAMRLRAALNQGAEKGQDITVNSIIVRAVALALEKFPEANGTFRGDHVEFHRDVHIGIAVAVDRGLVTPVVRNCHTKGLRQIDREVRVLAAKARDGKLTPADYEGHTFSVSNLGMFGVEEFQAIVNPPDAGIVAVGAVLEKPVVVDGQIVVGKRMHLTLSADHRILYGATAAQFLREIKRLLEHPMELAF